LSFFTKVRPDRDTPLLIVLGIAFSYFAVAVAGLLSLLAIADLLVPGEQLPFTVNERPVTAAEFLLTGGPFLVLVIAYFGAVGWGLRRHLPWVRYPILAYHALFTVIIVMTEEAREDVYAFVFQGCLLLAFSGWYFFKKKNVVAYFSDQPPPRTPLSKPIRPIGITLLAILLASQAISGAANGVFALASPLFPFTPRGLFGGFLLLHAITATATTVGLWKLKPWAHHAISAWIVSLALIGGLMTMFLPPPMAERLPLGLVALYALFIAGLGFLLYRYVRRMVT